MRHMLVRCADGKPYETELEDGETLTITKAGNVRLHVPGGRDETVKLESPAQVIYELVEVDRA